MEMPPSSNPMTDAAMYNSQIRARLHPDVGDGGIPVPLEVGDPGPQGLGVVLPERFDVSHLEAGLFHGEHDLTDVDEFTVGEHVASDERPRPDP